jgi:hypothetical protein
MLFVISSNDEKTDITKTGSIVDLAITGATQESLDSLIEMIDEDKEKLDSIEQELPVEQQLPVEQEEVTVEVTEEKQSLFSRIFSRKKTEETTNEDKSSMEQTESWAIIIEQNNTETSVVVSRDELIGVTGVEKTLTTQNVMKKSGTDKNYLSADIQKYAHEVLSNSMIYPGIDLETKIGNIFEVGVYSLKLNNKNFNVTLGYMMQWDTIRQLTSENAHGCFEIEIIQSQLDHSIGKIGYVCKKYLQELSKNIQSDTASEIVESTIIVNTQIGDFISIEKSNVMLWSTLLNIWDIIDQMSPADDNGCFVAHVYESIHSANTGKVWSVCSTDLY